MHVKMPEEQKTGTDMISRNQNKPILSMNKCCKTKTNKTKVITVTGQAQRTQEIYRNNQNRREIHVADAKEEKNSMSKSPLVLVLFA